MKKKILMAVIFLAFFIGVGIFVYYGQYRSLHDDRPYSGTIEATEAKLAFQANGRVTRVHIKEGQAVTKNQLLAELDPAELSSRREQAQNNLDRSQKLYEQAATSQQVSQEVLPGDVQRAEAALRSLSVILRDEEKNDRRFTELFQRGVVSEKEWDVYRLRHATAIERLAEGDAVLLQAKAGLKKIEAARRDAEAARAAVQMAKSSLEQARIQLDYCQLRAPADGIITSRNVEPGEVVAPGREVLTLADMSRVDLKIFVNEQEIGRVRPGQSVAVRIDTFPGKVFSGQVSYISPEGEFTPKIIQTKQERVKLVYLVKVSLPNPRMELKSGMPADAWLR